MKIIRCILKRDREKPALARHPWVFSGAIDEIDDSFGPDDLVKVYSHENQFLGIGYLNPRSQIAIRFLTFEDTKIDAAFFEKRIREALHVRNKFLPENTTACRLIHAEGDFLPGLVVDRYGEYVVVQFSTAGIEVWKDAIVEAIKKHVPCRGIFEKNDTDERELEGLETRLGVLWGQQPPDLVDVLENGIPFKVDLQQGQKTGFFLDQRESRQLVKKFAYGNRVLNCFSYTGAFSVYAAKGGATQVISVDVSEVAMNMAKTQFQINSLPVEESNFVTADVFDYLRQIRQEFDVVILDPPAFCKNKHQIQQASRGYKDINLFGMKRVTPSGLLFTYSCSSHIDPDLFQKVIFAAAKDARKNVRILQKISHSFDHPINVFHPEGEYLKGLICQIG